LVNLNIETELKKIIPLIARFYSPRSAIGYKRNGEKLVKI